MARGKLGPVDPSLPQDTYQAITNLWLYLQSLEKALNEQLVLLGDLVIDNAAKGLILKDTQATPHYWRVTVDNTGSLVTTDLGTSI